MKKFLSAILALALAASMATAAFAEGGTDLTEDTNPSVTGETTEDETTEGETTEGETTEGETTEGETTEDETKTRTPDSVTQDPGYTGGHGLNYSFNNTTNTLTITMKENGEAVPYIKAGAAPYYGNWVGVAIKAPCELTSDITSLTIDGELYSSKPILSQDEINRKEMWYYFDASKTTSSTLVIDWGNGYAPETIKIVANDLVFKNDVKLSSDITYNDGSMNATFDKSSKILKLSTDYVKPGIPENVATLFPETEKFSELGDNYTVIGFTRNELGIDSNKYYKTIQYNPALVAYVDADENVSAITGGDPYSEYGYKKEMATATKGSDVVANDYAMLIKGNEEAKIVIMQYDDENGTGNGIEFLSFTIDATDVSYEKTTDDTDTGDDETTTPDTTYTPDPHDKTTTTEKIEDIVEDLEDGDNLTINLTADNKTLDGDVIKEIKGKDVDVTIEVDDGIEWSFNGEDIPEDWEDKDISFDIDTENSEIPADTLKKVTAGKKSKTLSLAYDGKFGFEMTLTVHIGYLNDGQYANLYYYNLETKEFEFVESSKIGSNGDADFTFSHASDYVILVADKAATSSDIIDETTTTDKDADTDSDTTSGESNPKTGNAMPVSLAVLSLAAVAIVAKKKLSK